MVLMMIVFFARRRPAKKCGFKNNRPIRNLIFSVQKFIVSVASLKIVHNVSLFLNFSRIRALFLNFSRPPPHHPLLPVNFP